MDWTGRVRILTVRPHGGKKGNGSCEVQAIDSHDQRPFWLPIKVQVTWERFPEAGTEQVITIDEYTAAYHQQLQPRAIA